MRGVNLTTLMELGARKRKMNRALLGVGARRLRINRILFNNESCAPSAQDRKISSKLRRWEERVP